MKREYIEPALVAYVIEAESLICESPTEFPQQQQGNSPGGGGLGKARDEMEEAIESLW